MITPHLAEIAAPEGDDREDRIDAIRFTPPRFEAEPEAGFIGHRRTIDARPGRTHSTQQLTLEQASIAFRQQLTPPPFQGDAGKFESTPLNPIPDWVFLNDGDRVLLHGLHDVARPGTIDDVSEDASIVWVSLDGIGRLLVMETDGLMFSRLDTDDPR